MRYSCLTHTSESASALVPNSSETLRWFSDWRKRQTEDFSVFLDPERLFEDDTNEIYRVL